MAYVGHSDGVNSDIATNYTEYLSDLKMFPLVSKAYPVNPYVSLTSKCNMHPRCSMCFSQGVGKDLDSIVYDRLSKSLFKYSLGLCLTIDGEPIIYPSFDKVCDTINGWIILQTNGISKKLREPEILNNLKSVYISLDAATTETYCKFRPNYFDKVIDNTKFLLDYRKGKKCLGCVRLDFILMQCTKHEVFAFMDLAKSLGVDGVYIAYLIPVPHNVGDKSYHGFHFNYEEQLIPMDEVMDITNKCYSYGKKINLHVLGACK